jgi:putative PIN family toxin of toxin-antitoxin system
VKRVVADTNVIVSGLNSRGKPHEFLNLARSGQLQLAVSDAIIEETSRILRDKVGWSPERVGQAEEEIQGFAIRVSPSDTLDAVPGDPSHNRILECAIAADAEAIVSGDSHLLRLGSFDGSPTRLLYVARTRNGFTPLVRAQLMKKFKPLEVKDWPFANLPEPKGGRWGQGLTAAKMKECVWLKPLLVGQFEFVEWTPDDHLRHSRFIALRDDKKPRTVTREPT